MATPTQANPAAGANPRLHSSSPSFWASIFGAVLGLGLIGISIFLMVAGTTPLPLALGLLVVGIAECASSLYTMQLVRVAWAFALSINGTLAVVLLFSSSRIRDAAEVSIVLALLPCLAFGAIVLLHSLQPEDF